jgi:hypothetical protein
MIRGLRPLHRVRKVRRWKLRFGRSLRFEWLERRTLLTGVDNLAWTGLDPDAASDTTAPVLAEGEPLGDPVVTIESSDAGSREGEEGPGAFTISRSGPTAESLTVYLSISGSAKNNDDYLTLPTTLIFDVGQSSIRLAVTPVDDRIAEPVETVTVTVQENPNYTVGSPDLATVSITDNDVAGISVYAASELTTTEAGGTATFTVVLDTMPTANVTIAIRSSDVTEGTVSVDALTFTPTDWDSPQQVIVTGEDDAVADGDVAYTIVTGAASSSDPFYDGMTVVDVPAINLDNDEAPFRNPVQPTDVNNDGRTTPRDVLILINFLNTHGSTPLPSEHVVGAYLDVDGDNAITPSDVLLIINFINSQPAANGEGEADGQEATDVASLTDATMPINATAVRDATMPTDAAVSAGLVLGTTSRSSLSGRAAEAGGTSSVPERVVIPPSSVDGPAPGLSPTASLRPTSPISRSADQAGQWDFEVPEWEDLLTEIAGSCLATAPSIA